MTISTSVLELIGATPMVKAERLDTGRCELYLKLGNARGQRILKGTPEQIADDLQLWLEGDGADGFNLMPTHLPGGLDDFVDMVIPELQRRGIFRRDYEGKTLRDNLGLPRPPHPQAGMATDAIGRPVAS